LIKIRDSEGSRREIPLKIITLVTTTNWFQIYETSPAASSSAINLTIIHTSEKTNQYLLSSSTNSKPRLLNPAELMVPFAGSDFWLTDLGLEFLHWPGQRLVRDAKITMRLGRPCKVLESINPTPGEGTYGRAVSWIDSETGNLIYAEAYDVNNKRYKVFSLKHFTKVNGRWQVKDMELRNDKADSRTHLEFQFDAE